MIICQFQYVPYLADEYFWTQILPCQRTCKRLSLLPERLQKKEGMSDTVRDKKTGEIRTKSC